MHGELEPEIPSGEDVSVTALSIYCRSDSESNRSRGRGPVNTPDSQGQVTVTALLRGEKVCCLQEDSVRCIT